MKTLKSLRISRKIVKEYTGSSMGLTSYNISEKGFVEHRNILGNCKAAELVRLSNTSQLYCIYID